MKKAIRKMSGKVDIVVEMLKASCKTGIALVMELANYCE